jgi:DNA-binding NtrC family response regulator
LEPAPEVKPLDVIEREYITAAFAQLGSNVMRTARELKIDRRTLYRKLRSYGLLKSDACPSCGRRAECDDHDSAGEAR